MDRLKHLISLCKASVSVDVNDHKTMYQDVRSYFADGDRMEDVDPDVLAEMERRDCIVRVQAYPDTPIGFYAKYHYDLDAAVEAVISAIEGSRRGPA